MYEGTNRTALASQKSIAAAMVRLLEAKPFTSITISAVCKEADVSRQTFYTLFASKENIILYLLQKRNCFEPGKECRASLSLQDLAREYTSYIIEKQELLTLLVRNDLIYLMHQSLYNSFLDCSCFLPNEDETSRAFCCEFIAGGLSGIAKIYIEQGEQLSRQELEKTIEDLFSGAFFRKE